MSDKLPYWRPHDYISPRGIRMWFGPEWIIDLNGPQKLKPVKKGDIILLYVSVTGKELAFELRGRPQEMLQEWYENRKIDSILLGEDENSILESATNAKKD